MASAINNETTTPLTRLLIDTDVGLDDAQAIIMALACDDVIIEGITAVAGNTSVDNVCKNIRKVLRVCHRPDIPVYRGCQTPLIKPNHKVDSSGSDGFGDVKDDVKSDDVIQYEHAANYITEIVNKYPKQIVLVCLGPLTNVALAMKLDPSFSENLKECNIMGGNYRGQGNATPCSEFNFHFDPEAAQIVLQNLKCPTTLMCWEVCVDHVISWDQWERVYNGAGPIRSFIRRRELKMIDWKKKRNLPYSIADQFCMAVSLDRRLAAELFQAGAEVECHGGISRGMMVVKRKMSEGDHPVSIVMKMKLDKFLDYLSQAFDIMDHKIDEILQNHAQQNHTQQQRKFSKTISQYLPSQKSSSS